MIPAFLLKAITGNPLLLVWGALGISAVSLATGFGTAWTVQGWRLDAAKAATEVCNVKLGALGNQIETQNAAVSDLEKKAAAAKAKGAAAAKVAQGATQAHAALVRAWEARIAAPEGKTCQNALAEIRGVKSPQGGVK